MRRIFLVIKKNIYNIIILFCSVIMFLNKNFLLIEKVGVFSNLILSRASGRDKNKIETLKARIFEIQRKLKSKNFIARRAKIVVLWVIL